VEGAGYMNFEPKEMIQYGKTGLMILQAGKGAFSLIRRRPLEKHKKELRMKKDRKIKRQQQKKEGFFSAKKGVKKRAKIGLRALLIMKERYL